MEENNRKRKKGVLNYENYKRNVIKKAKVAGESHINWAGKRVPSKNDPDLIQRNCCKAKCLENINPPELLDDVLLQFYALESKNAQDLSLQRMIEIVPISKSRARPDTLNCERKPKSTNYNYHLLLGQKRTPVCKKAFINAHNITSKRVRRISNLLAKNVVPVDGRGMQTSVNAMPPEIVTKIDEHIKSFPVRESHYTTRSFFYLSANLNVKKMYNAFIVQNPELKDKVMYTYYWLYFKRNFTLTFGKPATDTCSKCEELNAKIKSNSLNEVAKRVAVAELLVHKNRSKKFYSALDKSTQIAKQNKKIQSVCFDFMAVLDLPKIPVQDVYYFRQLSVNTFGIYNTGNDKVTCYVYHEGMARKTPDDVCSFLLHYLKNFLDPEVEELHLFCDNCWGQNKNHALIRMLMSLVECGLFKKIKLHFPQHGHSFLPCDRSFGLIKRKLKEFDRLYTVDQYVQEVLLKASNINGKFTVFQPNSSIMYDFQNWYPQFYYKMKKSEVRGNTSIPFTISNYHYFEFNCMEPKVVKTKEFLGGLVSHYFHLRKPIKTPISLPSVKLYCDKIPLLQSKMADLKKLKEYIPSEFEDFWDELFEWPTENRLERDGRVHNL